MNLKPNSNSLNKPKLRTASLEDRLNTYGRKPLAEAIIEPAFTTLLQQSAPGIRWPFFSRLLADTIHTAQNVEWMRRELAAIAIGFVDPGNGALVPNKTIGHTSGRIIPLRNTEPIDAPKFKGGVAIELQMTGVPFVRTPPSRIHAWTPCFPLEVASFDHLAKKVELLRLMQEGVPLVGAAIAPAAVYDDIRLLADCGFDYVCLLLDILPEFASGASLLNLGSIESCLEPALKAIRDSGSKMKLWVVASSTDTRELYSLIQNGVDAVCIDAYLKTMKPADIEAPKDRYASVLSMAVPQVSPFAWVKRAVEDLGMQIEDLRTYHGV